MIVYKKQQSKGGAAQYFLNNEFVGFCTPHAYYVFYDRHKPLTEREFLLKCLYNLMRRLGPFDKGNN